MFIGHYGPAFGAKAALRSVPLSVMFIAVQWMDVCWSTLVLLGFEKVRIVLGFTEGSALDLYFMPYTHGLIGAIVLSLLFAAVISAFFRRQRLYVFIVLALAVFSHWVLDFLVHVPDLPLWGNTMKVGLGLWRHVWISLPLELATLVAGAALYVRTIPARRGANLLFWIFIALMTGVELYGAFGPPPADAAAEARTALAAYGALAVVAGLVDLTRTRMANVPVHQTA